MCAGRSIIYVSIFQRVLSEASKKTNSFLNRDKTFNVTVWCLNKALGFGSRFGFVFVLEGFCLDWGPGQVSQRSHQIVARGLTLLLVFHVFACFTLDIGVNAEVLQPKNGIFHALFFTSALTNFCNRVKFELLNFGLT